jgi:two-component system alkaline phosphatase synthesis response regulator PhoP
VPEQDQHRAAILVISDDEEIRDGVEVLLESDGYEIYLARNEKDAIETAARFRPDLMLVSLDESADVVTSSARRVRTLTGLSESVPIVMFSVPTVAEGAEVELGMNVYATRPDDFNQLRRLLGRLLGSSPARR